MKMSYDKEKYTTYYEKKCRECGKNYIAKAKNQLICFDCKDLKAKRYCKGCGKLIQRKSQQYCDECLALKIRPRYHIQCETCGKEFETGRGYMRFCSEECRVKSFSAVHEERECPFCGKTFITSNAKQNFCSTKCRRSHKDGRNPDLMRRGNVFATDKAHLNRVNGIYSQFEYIGGWENEFAYFLCKDCGSIFKHNTNNTKPSAKHNMKCLECEKILSSIHQKELQEIQKVKQEEAQRRREEKKRQKELEKVYVQKTFSTCSVCGSLFYSTRMNPKYCSKRCMQSVYWKQKDAYQRIIPLDKLFERDRGICHICGQKCDWDDYYTNENGHIVYGNDYPSRDHIIHKSKGGSHTWDNIKLAHRRCNSLRGTKEWIKIS